MTTFYDILGLKAYSNNELTESFNSIINNKQSNKLMSSEFNKMLDAFNNLSNVNKREEYDNTLNLDNQSNYKKSFIKKSFIKSIDSNGDELTKEIINNNNNIKVKISKNGKIIKNYKSKCDSLSCLLQQESEISKEHINCNCSNCLVNINQYKKKYRLIKN